MPDALSRVRESLLADFPDLDLRETHESTVLEVAAAHPAVGSLHIEFVADEITVYAGPSHSHFEQYPDDPPDQFLDEALAFLKGVLSDEIVLWSCLMAGGAYPVTRPRWFPGWLVRRFLWSGPLAR